MRIGILTFFESDNYGTVFQAYALQAHLEELGHMVRLIRLDRNVHALYPKKKHEQRQYTLSQRFLYSFARRFHIHDDEKKKGSFAAFRREYLHTTEKTYANGDELAKDIEQFDLIISGGDQIWNPYHKVFSLDYMCRFLPPQFRRISCGSSFGVEKIEDEAILQQMKDQLAKYSAVLVREKSGVNIVQGMGIRAEQVVDPVFLNASLWNNFITEQSPVAKPYGLIYALVDYPESDDRQICAYAKQNRLEMMILPENRRNYMNFYSKKFSMSPQDFINYIAHSEIVFTNSFHGLAFALLFRKRVVLLNTCTEEANSKQVRLSDLLYRFDVKNFDLENLDQEYSCDDKKIDAEIARSRKLLEQALLGSY